jgi:hypothetical protein
MLGSPIYRRFSLILIAASVALQGCAHMSEDECVSADWQLVGFTDGSQGLEASRLAKHQKVCSKHGVTPSVAAYTRGHQNGARSFCTPERGFNLGKYNSALPNICPADLAPGVVNGFNLGLQVYSQKSALKDEISYLRAELRAADNQIYHLEETIAEHEYYLEIAENGLIAPGLRASERLIFYTQRAELLELIEQAVVAIALVDEDRALLEQQISGLRREVTALNRSPMPALH